ncbi:MAG TPA: hypothetical protein O0Y17_01895 [Methanocorpusculum sp.]|nr:hypothetical protein [Methanocorpusculum sp.]
MYNWIADIPIKKHRFYRTEYILNDLGIFTKSDRIEDKASLAKAMWYVGTGIRQQHLKDKFLSAPHGRCAILWRKITSVEGDGEKITIYGNADSEIELIPEPAQYADISAYIEEQRVKHPLQKEADKEAACWFCFGLDEDWEAGVPLQDMIDEEITTAHNRIIEDDSLDATVIE